MKLNIQFNDEDYAVQGVRIIPGGRDPHLMYVSLVGENMAASGHVAEISVCISSRGGLREVRLTTADVERLAKGQA